MERARFGIFEADLKTEELRRQGMKVRLQAQPFGILAMLLERPGEIVSREDLRQRLWPADVFVDFDQGLNKAINKLRDALGDTAENPRFIETVPKKGYRFIAPVSPISDESSADQPTASNPALSVQAEPRPRKTYRNAVVVCSVALALALSVGLGWLWTRQNDGIYSVAVLPLVNSSSDASLEYLGDGLTESIINNLSQLDTLKVMARSTVFHYKEKETDPRAIGQALGVQAVLTGRVFQLGDKLVVDTELIKVSDGSQLWGEQYNRKTSDVFAVQEEIALQIASRLKIKLTGEQQRLLSRRTTVNGEAYQLYLRGRFYFNKRTDEGLLRAADYFRQAIAYDPNYALAYAGLADCYGLLGFESYPPKEYFPQAQAMATKALQLDDQLAEAHTSLAMIKALYEWDWTGAESEFRRAIELNPGYSTAHHWYGIHLEAMGRFDESRRELQRALELDPLSLIININSAYPNHYTHQYDAAIAIYRKTIEMDPNFAWAHDDLMLAYEQQGKTREAIQEAVILLRLSGESELAAAVQSAYSTGGYHAALERWLAGMQEQAKIRYVSPIKIAQLYTRLGSKDEAFAWLEKSYAEHCAPMVYLKVDPRYDSLRNDSRFSGLLTKMKLQ